MAYTQTELDALRAAYAKGVQEVQYDGQRVRYATGAEMRARIREIEAALGLGSRAIKTATPGYSRNT